MCLDQMGHLCRECDCASRVGRIAIIGRFQFHLGRVPIHRHWVFGMSFPMIVAHGRAFAPPQIAGRGVTLMNLFSISGVGFFSWYLEKCTLPVHQGSQVRHAIAIS